MYLANSLKMKKSDIGRFWNRDRTVVYNAVRKVGGEIEVDKRRLGEVQKIARILKKK
jgi:chromosomal replication initiation ATPase DnaA